MIGKIIKHHIQSMMGRNTLSAANITEPRDYSTIPAAGNYVPCQAEAYFLCLNKYIRENDAVLDVGFGLGYGLAIESIKASVVAGVDIDEKAIAFVPTSCWGKNPKIKWLKMYDGYSIDSPDNSFDIVSTIDVLEHVPDYDRFLNELLRVSKRGIFISTPNQRPEYTNKDGTPKNPWHLREWTFDQLNTILLKHGQVEWNFLNGPFEGPFEVSSVVSENTLTLSPFISKA